MKKFSIVLLALLLAGGFAFAATIDWELSGAGTSGVMADLDNNDYGMYYDYWADLDGYISAENAGEGDMYATISIGFEGFQDEADSEVPPIYFDDLSAAIYSGDLKIAFGSPTNVGGWVNDTRGYSSIDLNDSGAFDQAGVVPNFAAGNGNLGQGVAVTYDTITVGGVFRTEDTDGDDTYDTDWSLVADYADSLEGLDLNAEVALVNSDFYGSVKVGTDVEDWSVFVASDMMYDADNTGSEFDMDATVGVSGAVESVSLSAEAFYALNGEILAAFAQAGLDLNEDLSLSARVYTDDVLNNMTLGTSVTLTNATMIDGATLNLNYSNSDLLASNLGTVKAYAKVSL